MGEHTDTDTYAGKRTLGKVRLVFVFCRFEPSILGEHFEISVA